MLYLYACIQLIGLQKEIEYFELCELYSNGLRIDQMLLQVTVAAMEVCPQGCCSFFTVVCYAN